jgi:spermidine/putrescine transport system permease protein
MIEVTSQSRARPTAPPRVEGHRTSWRDVLLGFHSTLIYLFLYAPIAILVLFSFTTDRFGARMIGFTLDWYIGEKRGLIHDERLIGASLNTLKVALISTVVSTIIGTLTALALERYRFRGKNAFDALIYLPIVIPEIVMALSLLAFFAFSFNIIEAIAGWRFNNSLVTVIISHIAFSISFVVVVVRASLKGFDRRLEEAAQDLGANEWQTFWRITFPLILPGIIGGALLAFTLSLDDFIISFFTTGPGTSLLPVEVYNAVKGPVTPKINAISTVMLVLSMTLVAISQFIQQRQQR